MINTYWEKKIRKLICLISYTNGRSELNINPTNKTVLDNKYNNSEFSVFWSKTSSILKKKKKRVQYQANWSHKSSLPLPVISGRKNITSEQHHVYPCRKYSTVINLVNILTRVETKTLKNTTVSQTLLEYCMSNTLATDTVVSITASLGKMRKEAEDDTRWWPQRYLTL